MIRVDQHVCDACGTCAGVCPADAIIIGREKASINHDLCTGCLACIEVCPVGALTVESGAR